MTPHYHVAIESISDWLRHIDIEIENAGSEH